MTDELVHLIADLEADRASALRTLVTQMGLLTDGLHALRNGRTAVAEEFMDRAISAMSAEITKQRGR